MARGKFISDFERDVIRIGISRDLKAPQIARFLGRSKVAVYQQISAMEAEGTMENTVLDFVSEEIAQAIRRRDQ